MTQSGQMMASRCYLESGGKLGCISCHNPHGLPKGDPAVYFDAKCANCHGAGDGECSLSIANRADRTCIGCHMPRFPVTDIPHTALTDHRILRRPDFSLKSASPPPVSDVFDEGEPALPEWEIRRARALALRIDRTLAKTPEDIARAVETLRSLEPFLADDPEVSAMLADVLFKQGHVNDGINAAEKALTCDPTQRGVRQRLIEMYRQSGDPQRANEHQAVLTRLPPRRP